MSLKPEGRFYKGDPKYRYAGRYDTLAACMGSFRGITLDGVYTLDYKSSKDPKKYYPMGYPEWGLQTAGYRDATDMSEFDEIITGNATIRLDKFTGIPDVFDHSANYEKDLMAFRKLVEFYEWMYPERVQKGIPSVTTVIGVLEKPALIQWAANCAAEYCAGYADDKISLGETFNVLEMEEEAKKQWRKVKKKAADIGIEVHKHIEVFLSTSTKPHVPTLSIPVTNAWNAFMEFHSAVKMEVIATEIKVYGSF